MSDPIWQRLWQVQRVEKTMEYRNKRRAALSTSIKPGEIRKFQRWALETLNRLYMHGGDDDSTNSRTCLTEIILAYECLTGRRMQKRERQPTASYTPAGQEPLSREREA